MKEVKEAKAAETLEAFIGRHEAAAQKLGVVVTRIVFPGAESRIFPGVYAGIPVEDGKPLAVYSDGSTHA
ncbi:hypothetical protein [Cupriavidus gilardii]|uniref:hypothetical protein n=1 Tax=Cupriavidus gilardii TaxID=82541 RepID=UPI0021C2078B|nr:hypothetical protein [Cupriavidus gilardii]MCT9125404.1 hypothetical protein [Cupriavidus gilardii]